MQMQLRGYRPARQACVLGPVFEIARYRVPMLAACAATDACGPSRHHGDPGRFLRGRLEDAVACDGTLGVLVHLRIADHHLLVGTAGPAATFSSAALIWP